MTRLALPDARAREETGTVLYISRGAAIVETALSLSLVLLGMFAGVQFDYTSFQQLQLDAMAQFGARQVGSATSIKSFVSSAALGVSPANVSASPSADGHVPLQVVSITQNNLPSFFGLASPATLQSQSAELQFASNFGGGNANAYPAQQANGYFFDAQASLQSFNGYPYDVPCIPAARTRGYPENPPPAPIQQELAMLVSPPPMPGQAAIPATLPTVTQCTNEMSRQLGLFTRINSFGNGNLTMNDYINELACHAAWDLYFTNNLTMFDWSWWNWTDPTSDPSSGGWLYNANPEDYIRHKPVYPVVPQNASWLDMISDLDYMYALDSSPSSNGAPSMNCQFPTWFSYLYDTQYGGFPGADVPGQPGDIWPN